MPNIKVKFLKFCLLASALALFFFTFSALAYKAQRARLSGGQEQFNDACGRARTFAPVVRSCL